jgi:hypothetical protein
MIRNLKILVAAAMALVAFGAVGASGAQAAEFHCSVAPCVLTPGLDGTAKNSHHVFIVENEAKTESVSFTCNQITGSAQSSTKTATTVTLKGISYDTCTVNGSPPVTVDMNGCEYEFTNANGVNILCPEGKEIEVTVTNCTFKIAGGQKLGGIGYTTIGTEPNREVTISTNVTGIAVTASNPCAFINPSQKLIGRYTTGNTIVTGETTGGVMADAWYA